MLIIRDLLGVILLHIFFCIFIKKFVKLIYGHANSVVNLYIFYTK
jgi:hypothetical protein